MLGLVCFIARLYNRDTCLPECFRLIANYQFPKELKRYEDNYIKYSPQNKLFMVYSVVWFPILSEKLLPIISRNIASSKKFDQLCGRL